MTSKATGKAEDKTTGTEAGPAKLGRTEQPEQPDQGAQVNEHGEDLPQPGDKVSDDSAAGRVGPPFAVNETPVGMDGAGDPRPSNE